MQYNRIKEARFLNRPNRFIAHILVEGKEEICHVKNTGRCRELLIPGCVIYVEEHDDSKRKTKFSLIGVRKDQLLINMDSQAPNKVVHEFLKQERLFSDIEEIYPERTYGESRFDFYVKTSAKEVFIEVKGVTLEENGVAKFPDAPTERGIKHIEELCRCVEAGYEAYLILVIQLKGVSHFEPNDRTHKAFGDALRKAKQQGVHILAYDCIVTKDSLCMDQPVAVVL